MGLVIPSAVEIMEEKACANLFLFPPPNDIMGGDRGGGVGWGWGGWGGGVGKAGGGEAGRGPDN